MADVKISGLPASTVPLTGAEVLPIVQGGVTKQVSVANLNAVPSVTFANLPAASGVTNQIYNVSDVGINGSNWQSNGTTWLPVNGSVVLFKSNIPFYIAPTGTITVTTGVLTLGTALLSYQNPGYMYMYFPAGAWTGSTAGWYYVTMSSTTSGLVYSNTYTTGIPTIPTSPTLVTTGAGAYTGVSGSPLAGPNISIPANVLINSAGLRANLSQGNNSSAGAKIMSLYINNPGIFMGGTTSTTGTEYSIGSYTVIQGTSAASSILRSFSTTSISGYLSAVGPINLTATSTLGFSVQTAVATDWVGCLMGTIVLERLS
jgi:hypothetical protein